jgi:hypothetical protein
VCSTTLVSRPVPARRVRRAPHPAETAWAITAVLALADASHDVACDGNMRHLPLVGALPTRPQTTPFLPVEQANNGDTFLVTDAPGTRIGPATAQAHPPARLIGGWEPEQDHPAPLTF